MNRYADTIARRRSMSGRVRGAYRWRSTLLPR